MDQEKILLSVGVSDSDISKAIKAIQTARTEIDKLKASQKELTKSGEGNSEQFILQEQEIRKLNGVVGENSRILQANTKAVEANEHGLAQLKKENSALIKQRDQLNTSTDEGRKKITELNAKIDANSKVINDNSSSIEKQRMNIGNYSSALDGIVPGLGGLATQIGTAGQASGSFTKGIGEMTKAAWKFVANPIGAVIAALVLAFQLVSTFVKNSAVGMDLFEDATAAVSAVVDVVIDRVVKFVGALGSLLSGDIIGGISGMKDSFSGVGDEIAREVKLAQELAGAIRDLEDREIDYRIAAGETENQIKRLLLQARNRSLTEQERIEKLQQAADIEKKQNEEQVAIEEERLRIANDTANQRISLSRIAGESELEFGKRLVQAFKEGKAQADELRDAVIDGIDKRQNAEASSLALLEKIQNQRDALEEKAEADREKRAEKDRAARQKREEEILKAAKTEEDAIRALNEFRLQEEIKAASTIDSRVEKELELEAFKRSELLKNAELTATQIQLINEQAEANITAIKDKGLKDREALEITNRQKTEANLAADLQKMITQANEELQIEINKEKTRLLNGEITQQEYNDMLAEAEMAALQVQQDIRAVFGEEDLALNARILDAKIAQKRFETETAIQLEQQKAKTAADIFGQAAGLANKQTIAFKLLASGQAIMNTYAAATAALAPPPTGAGPIVGPIFAALAIAAGLKNIAEINRVKLPKMAQGGMIPITGKDHAQGGEIVRIGNKAVAEVQGGEDLVVMKRGARGMLKTLATANKLAGGRDFYTNQAPQRYLADGGFVTRAATSQVVDTITKREFMEIRDSIADLTIIVKPSEIDRVNANKAKAALISELQ